MSAVESSRRIGYPFGGGVGNPPRVPGEPRGRDVSRDKAADPRLSTGAPSVDPDEAYAAALCRLRHGDPYDPDHVKAAHQGMSDLIGRTWKADREPTRDDRRLMARYKRTIEAAEAAEIDAYRRCEKCSGSTEWS